VCPIRVPSVIDQLRDDLNSAAADGGGVGEGAAMPVIDTYGSGRDEAEIRDTLAQATPQLPIRMYGAIDHAHESLRRYRVFINPSTSEVPQH
jgi:hypothetical protein